MNSIGRVSDEEVSAAIRYLDPEVPDGWRGSQGDRVELRQGRLRAHIDWNHLMDFCRNIATMLHRPN